MARNPEVAYISTDLARDARDYPTCHAILTSPIPKVVNPNLRDSPRKAIAAEIRKLLKSLGIKGLSVTAPQYANAEAVHIEFRDEPPHPNEHDRADWTDCQVCTMYRAAGYRLEVLILAAFPDLDDRSDYEHEHYDFILSIH